MKRIFIVLCLFTSFVVNATPGTGGYFGHRLTLTAEGSYAPFWGKLPFIYPYDLQAGMRIQFVTGRYSGFGISFASYKLMGNDLYKMPASDKSDRISGTSVGMNYRVYRKNRGAMAPLGKYVDAGITYSINSYLPGANNPYVLNGQDQDMAGNASIVTAHCAFGTQGIFWNRVVADTGLRFGYPMAVTNGVNADPIYTRISYKEIFSMYFGVGILL